MVSSLLFYGVMQTIKLLSFDETDIMVSTIDSHFDSDFVFSKGLMFAFAITVYDNNPNPIEDPSYGVVSPFYKTWGLDSDDPGVKFERMPTRNCTEAELHVNGKSDSNSPFFVAHKNSHRDLAFYYRKLKCLDTETVDVQGDYNAPRTRAFVLMFEKCNPSTFEGTCKSEEEINKYLARKFIIILMN